MEENNNSTAQKMSGGVGNTTSTHTTKADNSDYKNLEHQTDSSNKNDVASQISSVINGDTGAVKNLYDTAKESGGQVAGQVLDQAKEKASSVIEEQKSNLAAGLGSVADGIRQVGGNLRDGGSDEKNSIVESIFSAHILNFNRQAIQQAGRFNCVKLMLYRCVVVP